ncbi:hypothetical protein [Streptomyces daliensis]|uniref:Secreted protein n=1 Tax=Streptomyces daliensis TaxID=299421 RepID=A0A8T4J7B6_9ACTN|nr:hypothetical protein [Streptomyces daliensis]
MRDGQTSSRWLRLVRTPWTAACVTVAVVLGPAVTTASALDQANASPRHRPYSALGHQQNAVQPAPVRLRGGESTRR